MATSESCCTLGIDCGGLSGAQFSELRRKSLKSLELARAVTSIELDEGRQEALKRGERVELREVFSIEPRIQKARISRNPRTNEKVNTPQKKSILFKMSKDWAKKANEKV